mmetsp:Transcript_31758/g.69407  ORF Transcript_31758/g.69407 Transcript_31758/m.69407 type:complete len:233 (-) Transcript_31758:437-1135(-)
MDLSFTRLASGSASRTEARTSSWSFSCLSRLAASWKRYQKPAKKEFFRRPASQACLISVKSSRRSSSFLLYLETASSTCWRSVSERARLSRARGQDERKRPRRAALRTARPAAGPSVCSVREAWKETTSSFKRLTWSFLSSSRSGGSPVMRRSVRSSTCPVRRPSRPNWSSNWRKRKRPAPPASTNFSTGRMMKNKAPKPKRTGAKDPSAGRPVLVALPGPGPASSVAHCMK